MLNAVSARSAIRYLKRGVFPPNDIAHFTLGRDKETKIVSHLLAPGHSNQPGHLFVQADYGSGKSHLLRLVEAMSLERGWAVTWVTLNNRAHAFNHPTRYLSALLKNLRVPYLPHRGIVRICTHWLSDTQSTDLLAWASSSPHTAISRAVLHLAQSSDDDYSNYCRGVLEGRDLQHRSGAACYSNFFSRLAEVTSLCNAVGLPGIVILFDEVETIATLLTNVRSRLRSYELLDTMTTVNRFPLNRFVFATTPDFADRVNWDQKIHADFRPYYPEAFRFIDRWLDNDVKPMALDRLGNQHIGEILDRIQQAHELAYGWNLSAALSKRLQAPFLNVVHNAVSHREIIKCFVEELEMIQQNEV